MTFKMFKKIIYLVITLYMYILNKMNLKIIKQSLLKLFDWIKANTAKIKKKGGGGINSQQQQNILIVSSHHNQVII